MVCSLCGIEQPPAGECAGCGVSFGAYFCATCVFYDDEDKGQFHCDKCVRAASAGGGKRRRVHAHERSCVCASLSCVRVRVCAVVCVCARVCVCVCVCVCWIGLGAYAKAAACTLADTLSHSLSHAHTRTHTHSRRTHTRTHTHVLALRRCGICRVGGADQYFHCDKCGCCYSVELRDNHKCVERSMHSNCPVCFEYLFDR